MYNTNIWLVLLLIPSLILVGCGDEVPPTPQPPPADAVPRTPAQLLRRVHTQVVEGRGLSGDRWQQNLEALADLLWPPNADGTVPEAVGDHMRLLQVAGDAGRTFARDPRALEAWRERLPEDLAIYESFVAASEQGPDAYRTWVAGPGGKLLRDKEAALQRQFEQR